MKKQNTLIWGSLLVLSLVACQGASGAKENLSAVQKEISIPVRTTLGHSEEVVYSRKFSSELTGHIQKNVYAALPEIVKEIPVEIGQKVQKGQILARLEKEGRTAYYRQAKAQYEVLQKSLERLESLVATGGVAPQKLDELRAQFQASKANYDAVKQNVNIESPIDGVVTDIYLNRGEVAISGKDEYPLMQISDLKKMRAKLNVPESEIALFKLGQSARVVANGSPVIGKVVKVPLAANPRTRTFAVEVEFPNGQKQLYPGTYKQIEVQLKKVEGVKIPLDAVLMEGEKLYYYKVEKGVSLKKELQALLVNDEYAVVSSAEVAGSEIVISGLSLLQNGVKVHSVNPSKGQEL